MIEPPSLSTPPTRAAGAPPDPPSTAPAWESTPASAPPASPVAGWGAGLARFAAVPIAHQLRNFAIGGAVLGALVGLARAATLHVPPGGMALAALRMAAAGAAWGASVPAAIRAVATLARAAGWIVLALALGWLALVITGRLEWVKALVPPGS